MSILQTYIRVVVTAVLLMPTAIAAMLLFGLVIAEGEYLFLIHVVLFFGISNVGWYGIYHIWKYRHMPIGKALDIALGLEPKP